MNRNRNRNTVVFKGMLLTLVTLSSVLVLTAQDTSAPAPATTKPQSPATASKQPTGSARYTTTNQHPLREQMYYLSVWGIDELKVKYTESGEMIRFSYRVVDPRLAAQLNDKKAEPGLYAPSARVKLSVPQMEKVGKLRQTSTPIEGQSYWMAFANPGRRVKRGDRVSVEIGNFRAINLLVE